MLLVVPILVILEFSFTFWVYIRYLNVISCSASFEMMRKEQQKALQEKQKTNPGKHKAGGVSDLFDALADSKEESGLVRNSELEVSAAIPILSNDLEKLPFTSHSPVSRPLIPPGFRNNTQEKSSSLKSLIHPTLSEVCQCYFDFIFLF